VSNERVQPALVPPRAVADCRRGEVLDLPAAGDETCPLERGDLELEAPRQCDVVPVHAGKQRRTRFRAGVLERRYEPARDSQGPEASVASGMSLRGRHRVVGRAVVDEERLEVAERLGRDRRERLGEIRSLVSEGKENRDERAAQMPRTST
jgi:hypothetical protein